MHDVDVTLGNIVVGDIGVREKDVVCVVPAGDFSQVGIVGLLVKDQSRVAVLPDLLDKIARVVRRHGHENCLRLRGNDACALRRKVGIIHLAGFLCNDADLVADSRLKGLDERERSFLLILHNGHLGDTHIGDHFGNLVCNEVVVDAAADDILPALLHPRCGRAHADGEDLRFFEDRTGSQHFCRAV